MKTGSRLLTNLVDQDMHSSTVTSNQINLSIQREARMKMHTFIVHRSDCVYSSFAIIWKSKRKLFALLLLSNRCIVTLNAAWLFLTVPWVGLQCVIVVFRFQIILTYVVMHAEAGMWLSCSHSA